MGIFSNFFRTKKPVRPEDEYTTEITQISIKVRHPHREEEEIKWADINSIKLINTDEGPFSPDIWLVLLGEDNGCSIPHGSKGYDLVYDIISTYEGFNFENVINSMGCATNETFELWEK